MLETVVLGNGMIEVPADMFSDCPKLKNVTWGSNIEIIKDDAFRNTAIEAVDLPDSVKEIWGYAFYDCQSLKSVTLNANLEKIGYSVFTRCGALKRIFYKGMSSQWAQIEIGDNNDILAAPYYYSEANPKTAGNYWYYTAEDSEWCEDGNKRIWNINESVYQTERYSELFLEFFSDEEDSYATTFLNSVEKEEKAFLAGVAIWETGHVVSDPSYLINWEEGIFSKKDLYKFTLMDLLLNQTMSAFDLASVLDNEYVNFMYDSIKIIFDKESSKGLEALKEALKDLKPKVYEDALKECGWFKVLDEVGEYLGEFTNAYDAVVACSKYMALASMEEGFVKVLEVISKDYSNPDALCRAAKECIEIFRDACKEKKVQFFVGEMFEKDIQDCLGDWIEWAWKTFVPGGLALSFAIDGIRALGNSMFAMDDIIQAYYQLKISVYIENAVRKIIKQPIGDYLNYENSESRELYKYSIELYKRALLKGFDFSIDWLEAYKKSAATSDKEKEEIDQVITNIQGSKNLKISAFEMLEDVIEKEYDLYYKNSIN